MGRQVCKLQVVDTFGYDDLDEILQAIKELGYVITFVSNGNILVEEREEKQSLAVSKK